MATKVQIAALAKVIPAAQMTARQWRVPASITLAQWTLESGWGTSQLARQANNYFGIKASQGQNYAEFPTHEVIRGRSIVEMADFARYGTAADSFAAHAHLLATLPRYKPAMACLADIRDFARALQICGYSTSKTYGTSLYQLIVDERLAQYDVVPPPAAAAVAA